MATLAARPLPDLDVAVPPGSPLDWIRSFPAVEPDTGPLFPTSRESATPTERTVAQPMGAELDVRIASSYGLVQILTWDLTAHMTWIDPRPVEGPRTGERVGPPLPGPGDPLYWVSLAPLLRLLLHPASVSRAETLAHLAEIGTPVLSVLDQARSESALRSSCNKLESLVVPARDPAPKPLVGGTLRETMLKRFVLEELQVVHPYDPVSAFGEHFFLFGDDVEPILIAYAKSENPFVRRSAVVAIGRYRTRAAADALVELVKTTDDPVVLLRAASGIARMNVRADFAPILERMEDTRDPVLRAPLMSTLGHVGLEDAVPELLRLGTWAWKRDGEKETDILLAAVTALARIRHTRFRDEVRDFASKLEEATRTRPRNFRPVMGRAKIEPDRPDAPEKLGQTLNQIALSILVQLDPNDEEVARKLLGWLSPSTLGDPRRDMLGPITNASLGWIHPAAQPHVLVALGALGEPGWEALRQVAGDETRWSTWGMAVSRLPFADRSQLVAARLEGGISSELAVQAFSIAVADEHPDLKEMGEKVLAEFAAMPPGSGDANQRYLCLIALRALGDRNLLDVDDLYPLLHHVRSPREAFGELPDLLRKRVEKLVRDAAGGAQKVHLRRDIDAILDVVFKNRMNPALSEEGRSKANNHVIGQLSQARSHRSDANYLRLLTDAILEYLLGFPVESWNRFNAQFTPRVLLEDEILLALGRTGEARAAEGLVAVLKGRKNKHRAVALLAVGMTGQRWAARDVAGYLVDPDPFTRFCAYESLRHLTGKDVSIDWMYGTSRERFDASQEYLKWIAEHR